MRASGNEIGRTIVRAIHQTREREREAQLTGLGGSCSSAPSRSTAAILEALAARDGELAAERIAAHIESAWAERRRASARRLGSNLQAGRPLPRFAERWLRRCVRGLAA